MDAVCLGREVCCIGRNTQQVHDAADFLADAGGRIGLQHCVDHAFQWSFIYHAAIRGEERILGIKQRVFAEKILTEYDFMNSLTVKPWRPWLRRQIPKDFLCTGLLVGLLLSLLAHAAPPLWLAVKSLPTGLMPCPVGVLLQFVRAGQAGTSNQ